MSTKWTIIIVFVAILIGFALRYKSSDTGIIQNGNFKKEPKFEVNNEQESLSRDTKTAIQSKAEEQTANISNELFNQAEKILPNVIVKNEKGEVLENATLEILDDNEKSLFLTTTDKMGKGNLNYCSRNKYEKLFLITSHDNYASKIIESFTNYKYSDIYPLEIILKKGFAVRGLAIDKEGKVLPDMTIKLPFDKKTVKTNANGKFEFPNVESKEVVFSGWGNNFFYKGVGEYHLPQKEDIVLIFTKGCELVVKVVDINKKGIANAELGIYLSDGWNEIGKIIYTESDGSARLPFSREDITQISISHPQFVKSVLSQNELNLNSVIILEKGKKIKGVITDKNSLIPIKDARVWCQNNEHNIQTAETNERGEYEISCLSNGENSLVVYCDGYQTITHPKFLLANQDEIVKDFSLDKGNNCRIKMVDAKSKKPIVKKVLSYSNYFIEKPVQVLTNKEGEFNLSLPDGSLNSSYSYFFQIDGYADIKKEVAYSNQLVVIELSQEVIFKLNVTDSNKQPIRDLVFRFDSEIRNEINYIFNSISQCYEIKGFPEGPLNLEIKKSNFVSTIIKENLVIGKENNFNIMMKPIDLLTISLKIISPNKKINLSELKGSINLYTTDDYNSIAISLNNNNHKFEAAIERNNYQFFEVEFPHHLKSAKIPIENVNEDTMEYEVTLNSGRGFDGEIVDENGEPVIGSSISIKSQDSDSGNPNSKVMIGENGKFFSYGLLPGRFWLTVQNSDYFDISREVELTSDKETNLKIILKKGIQISGVVFDSNGKIIGNASVNLLHIPEKLAGEDDISYFVRTSVGNTYSAETNQNGEFIFKNVPIGRCEISVFSYLGRLDKFPLEVKNEINDLRLTLDQKIKISGTLLDENNKPIKNLRVSIESNDFTMVERHFESSTDDNGYFEFSGVLNIKYKLKVFGSTQYFLDDETYLNGGDANINLILSSKKVVICNVVNQDGVEIKTNYVSFYYEDSSSNSEIQSKRVTNESLYSYTFEKYEDKLVKAIATVPGYSPGVSDAFNPKHYTGQPIIIKVQKNISLDVHVMDYYSKNLINDASVNFKTNEALIFGGHTFLSYANTNSNGEATLDGLVLGKGKIEVRALGQIGFEAEVNISDDNPVLKIYLKRGGSIKGILIDNKNKPLASSPVLLRLAKQNDKFDDIKTITDEKGFYEFKNIPPNSYLIGTEINSSIQYTPTFAGIFVVIEENQITNITMNELIALNGTAKVKISLKGKNIANKEICIHTDIKSQSSPPNLPKSENEDTIEAVFETSKDGIVTIPRLALGRYTIKIFEFEEIINIPFTVENEKELNFEIPVMDKIIKIDEEE